MAMIARSMLALVAPTLTYTADEVLEYAPAVVKGEWGDVFDLEYDPLPELDAPFDDSLLMEAREAFGEAVDRLKKEKVIKATLELALAGDVEALPLRGKDLEDWFVVSAAAESFGTEELGAFEAGGKRFTLHRAPGHKCPRCWRYAAEEEGSLCPRCAEVLG
jgi:isoleucyl-tRNA synthetase